MRMRLALAALATALLLSPCAETKPQTSAEKTLEKRLGSSNGINVGEPKVFDDSLLQQMLNSAESQLVSLQVLNQSGISANFGVVTGANQQISSFALSAQGGPPSATTAVTDNGATTQVANTAIPGGTGNSTVTTSTAPVQNTTTTLSPPTPVTATPPAPSSSLPSAFGVSASDILNEQMQVTYEIANLRLLLEGPLSDRILQGKDGHVFLKARTTLGFPITITPDKRFKDAIAVVEVEVETDPDENLSTDGQPPTITALLPREKTYNVAAIKDKSVSIGGGVATQLVGVSAAFLSGHKSYYLVKDQDTVALTFPTTKNPKMGAATTGFLWEFRPVLGQRYVQAGIKQTFVQLSFPTPQSGPILGSIHVRTYWRKVDRATGLLKEVVPHSLNEDAANSNVPVFDMTPNIRGFSPTDVEDLGNGQMLVTLMGNFLGGTYVRVGSSILQGGSAGFTSEYRQIRFVASISDLATKNVSVVTRDGTAVALKVPADSTPYDPDKNPIRIKNMNITAVDESNSLLQVEINPVRSSASLPLVLVIGGKVFGYNDAPIRREGTLLSVVLPTSFLVANPEITIKPLFVDDTYLAKRSLFAAGTEIERIVMVQQDAKSATYLLFGKNLAQVKAVAPTNITLKPVGNGQADDALRQIEVSADVAKSLKQIILQRPNERPFVVAVPAPPAADATAQTLKFQERVTIGADEAVIVGDNLKSVSKVQFQKKDLTISKRSDDGKSITVTGLASAGATAVAKTQDIDVLTPTGKLGTIKLEVVSSKVETVAK
jgi:hypothetical protein